MFPDRRITSPQIETVKSILEEWSVAYSVSESFPNRVVVKLKASLILLIVQMERIFPDLDLHMYVMVSAPPMPNGIADWAGYMSFTEHPDADL